jgi:hypothetical protein
MTRRRRIWSIYSRVFRTYRRYAGSLLIFAVIVFVPLGLLDTLASEVNLDALDLTSGIKIAAVAAAVAALTTTSLLGEVFYSGTVSIYLSHPADEPAPGLGEVARRIKYWRLIAIDVLYVAVVVIGLVFLFVPGALLFVFLGLAGPIVELEGRSVRGAFARSFHLVRHNFWVVFFVLVPLELVGDAIGEMLDELVHSALGHNIFAGWAAESISNIALSPLVAVAAVLLTLDLIAAHERTQAEVEADAAAAPA